jgi:hypothetical protein
VTNLLAMPLVTMTVVTGTNEDWVDSIKYLVDNGSGDPDLYPQLDLTGIAFSMEVRRLSPNAEVVIRASTADGTLGIGDAPNTGYLLINVDHEMMKTIKPGGYSGDIVGQDAVTIRRCVVIDLEIALGITRP